MFDNLVISNADAAENKKRGRYFAVSTFIVGVLFCTAVVLSIYAAEIHMIGSDLDSARLLMPVMDNVPEPEPPRENRMPDSAPSAAKTELPTRQKLIARIDQHQTAPKEISSVKSAYKTIPDGRFIISDTDSGGSYSKASVSGSSDGTPGGTGSPIPVTRETSEVVKPVEPPPVLKKPEPKTIQSLGVVNGIATHLPKPPFPQHHAIPPGSNEVRVQITISEQGDVIAANAISGHPLLRANAVNAARQAKFKPTLLSNRPVKATGMIVYRFNR